MIKKTLKRRHLDLRFRLYRRFTALIYFVWFGLDSTLDFKFNFTHSDNNGMEKSSYTIGEDIKFHITLNSKVDSVKAVLQRCWSTSDGSSNVYNLINNRLNDFLILTLNLIFFQSIKFCIYSLGGVLLDYFLFVDFITWSLHKENLYLYFDIFKSW